MSLDDYSSPTPSVLDQGRRHLRQELDSNNTEWAYVQAINRFILFHHERHPREMGLDFHS
jgi:hypothetical protein